MNADVLLSLEGVRLAAQQLKRRADHIALDAPFVNGHGPSLTNLSAALGYVAGMNASLAQSLIDAVDDHSRYDERLVTVLANIAEQYRVTNDHLTALDARLAFLEGMLPDLEDRDDQAAAIAP